VNRRKFIKMAGVAAVASQVPVGLIPEAGIIDCKAEVEAGILGIEELWTRHVRREVLKFTWESE